MAYENDAASYIELSLHECGREECLPDKTFHFTPKEYHLFHYVLRGKGIFSYKGYTYKLKRGDVFYIPPREVPTYHPDPSDPWTYEWIGIGGSRAAELIEKAHISASKPVFHDETLVYKTHFDAIANEYLSKGKLNLYCLGQVYSLFGRLFGNELTSADPTVQKTAHLLAAKEYIHNNYQFDISVDDIAKNVGITANYLSSLFNAFEGMSTKFYLTKVRMEVAATILRSGAYLIKDAGAMVGYKNQLHFSSEFRKYYGMCPSEFAKKEKKQ